MPSRHCRLKLNKYCKNPQSTGPSTRFLGMGRALEELRRTVLDREERGERQSEVKDCIPRDLGQLCSMSKPLKGKKANLRQELSNSEYAVCCGDENIYQQKNMERLFE